MLLPCASFQDANFETRREWRWSPNEGWSLRWVPFGVPRLNHSLPNSVFFLYRINPRTGKREGPIGTGFLVGFSRSSLNPLQGWARHIYAVSCHHVAVADGATIMRINTKDGKSRFIELESDDWHFDPNGDDLAIADVTDRVDHKADDICLIPTPWAMEKKPSIAGVGIGEDGFMLGLFADAPGSARNAVAGRFGNVSMMAQDDLPIATEFRTRPSHLFDIRSRPGFSGSPVFVYRTPAADLRNLHRPLFKSDASSRDSWKARDNTFIKLLGIHVGQFDDRVKVKRPEAPKSDPGEVFIIPNSVAVVTPSWSIIDLLNIQYFVEQRQKREDGDADLGFPTVTME